MKKAFLLLFVLLVSSIVIAKPILSDDVSLEEMQIQFSREDSVETEPNDSYDDPGVLLVGNGNCYGLIDPGIDEDYWAFSANSGNEITITTAGFGLTLDTEIWLYGGNGTTELAHNDDAGQGIYQSTINFTISESATYYFKIGSYASFIGDYQVELSGIAELSTDDELELPRHYLKCYPNPFHTSTSIKFTTGKTGMNSEISIYNLKGQKVRTFSDLQNNKSPNQQIFWNGTGENGKPVSSGIYLYKFSTDDRCKTARMMILKSN